MERRFAGPFAWLILVFLTGFWTYWSFLEMFHEGWWGGSWERLRYLIPAGTCYALCVLNVVVPRIGAFLLLAVGVTFGTWWTALQVARGSNLWNLIIIACLSFGLAVVGVVLFVERVRMRRAHVRRGRWRVWTALGVPLALGIGITAVRLPAVMSRVDDGRRDARRIEGKGVELIWAPAGPGWGRGMGHADGHPSWDAIALYGVEPMGFDATKRSPGGSEHATLDDMRRTGASRYLAEDGLRMMPEPVDAWRMPSVDEITRSLVRRGTNAGGRWNGELGRIEFEVEPDKETPLWDPQASPIYLWAFDESSASHAYYVSYNGWVGHQPKSFGNPRHGYRFVKDP